MAIQMSRANPGSDSIQEVPISDPAIVEQVAALEEELRDVSAELASSIRREMELEDVVDRLQAEGGTAAEPESGERTSDHFSESDTNSSRGPVVDLAAREMEVERLQRKGEQEKAQLRLRLTQKIQNERLKRKALEERIRKFEERGLQVRVAEVTIGVVMGSSFADGGPVWGCSFGDDSSSNSGMLQVMALAG